MDQLGVSIVGVAIFTFLAIAAVAGTVSEYKKRRAELELLHVALELGQPLDPALIEHLTTRHKPGPESEHQPVDFRIGGIMTVASGIGVALMSFFLTPVAPSWFYPVMGIGVIVVCIGVALLICARVIEHHKGSQATGEKAA